MTAGARDILVVDDNPADVRLIREVLTQHHAAHRLHTALDGAAALRFLCSERADLVLLDLNLPGIGGHDLLSLIRALPRAGTVPVVVFSSSDAPEDIERAYQNRANSYLTKLGQLDAFFESVRKVCEFWLETAKLPQAR